MMTLIVGIDAEKVQVDVRLPRMILREHVHKLDSPRRSAPSESLNQARQTKQPVQDQSHHRNIPGPLDDGGGEDFAFNHDAQHRLSILALNSEDRIEHFCQTARALHWL